MVVASVYSPGEERVKGTVSGVATVYVGEHYEVQGTTVRKYYYAGSQRMAMRENGTLYWLLTDHLGSTAITANGTSGAKVAEVRYKAWGEDRYTYGTTPTTYRYTGQRWEAGLGLYFYRARWYAPALGRFVQPDTIVPNNDKQAALTPLLVDVHETDFIVRVGKENHEIAQYGFWFQRSLEQKERTHFHQGPPNPQAMNRYSYVLNCPLRYIDPSGHTLYIWIPPEYVLEYIAAFRKLGTYYLSGMAPGLSVLANILGELHEVPILNVLLSLGFFDLSDPKSLGEYFLALADALEDRLDDPNGVWVLISTGFFSGYLFEGITYVYGGSEPPENVHNYINVQVIPQPPSVLCVFGTNLSLIFSYAFASWVEFAWGNPNLENAPTGRPY